MNDWFRRLKVFIVDTFSNILTAVSVDIVEGLTVLYPISCWHVLQDKNAKKSSTYYCYHRRILFLSYVHKDRFGKPLIYGPILFQKKVNNNEVRSIFMIKSNKSWQSWSKADIDENNDEEWCTGKWLHAYKDFKANWIIMKIKKNNKKEQMDIERIRMWRNISHIESWCFLLLYPIQCDFNLLGMKLRKKYGKYC